MTKFRPKRRDKSPFEALSERGTATLDGKEIGEEASISIVIIISSSKLIVFVSGGL
jgi:hypothetical protein